MRPRATACTNWPAPIHGPYHKGDATGGDWVGSLIPGMQDTSGLLYKRNRYYSPETGQFTQTDPIGLAGGLNTYGFGEGDPVTYSDPYGLAACDKLNRSDCSKSELIALGVADRLGPAAPALNLALEIILMASPDPFGEGRMLFRGLSRGDEVVDAFNSARSTFSFNSKIGKQISKRGWSVEAVDEVLANPARTQATRDVRYMSGGRQMNDPATAYFDANGAYVVRNHETLDIVQVSNRHDAHWITDLPPP